MVTRRAKEGGCGRGRGAGARVREEGRRLGGEAGRGANPITAEIPATHAGLGSRRGMERRAWCSGNLDAP